MDTLPVETLQHIFEIACADGGHTGCALSRTCKAFRAAARPLRFRMLSLTANSRRLQSFVALYERECDPARGDKPRVRHLYIAFPRLEGLRGGRKTFTAAPPTNPRSDSDAEEYPDMVQRLFRLVAPDLVTLTIQCGFVTPGGASCLPMLSRPFPQLRSLTLLGVHNPRALLASPIHSDGRSRGAAAHAEPSIENLALFPALTHLRLGPGCTGRNSADVDFWATHAPRATHLYAAHADTHVTALVRAAGMRLADPDPAGAPVRPARVVSSTSGAPRALPSVRQMCLQPNAVQCAAWCGGCPSYATHRAVLHLEDLVAKCREADGGVDVCLLDPPDNASYCPRAKGVHREWLESIQDGSIEHLRHSLAGQ
ncbi:hypothetical protein BD413DRAFT_627236 [Trametes elegans]|nr:hypothetical protein BD413DRAFT_627236 [Trametes elegans]